MRMTPKILRVLAGEKISIEELSHMLEHAAITSVDGCNQRYFQWGFLIDRDAVLRDMRYVDLQEIGSGSARVYEEHEGCHGRGCRGCGWVGEVVRRVSDDVARTLEGDNDFRFAHAGARR